MVSFPTTISAPIGVSSPVDIFLGISNLKELKMSFRCICDVKHFPKTTKKMNKPPVG